MRNVLGGGKNVWKMKTQILFSIFFFRKSCRLRDNVEKYCRAGQATDGNTTRRMSFTCWINKATSTHSENVILAAFAQPQWLHERKSPVSFPASHKHPVGTRRTLNATVHSSQIHTLFVPEIEISGLNRSTLQNTTNYLRKLSSVFEPRSLNGIRSGRLTEALRINSRLLATRLSSEAVTSTKIAFKKSVSSVVSYT